MSLLKFVLRKFRTKVIKLDPSNPDPKKITTAAGVLKNGGLVVFPTETVYGLGADYRNKEAVKKVYDVKKRSLDKPLTIHIADISVLNEMECDIPPVALRLIATFWPNRP